MGLKNSCVNDCHVSKHDQRSHREDHGLDSLLDAVQDSLTLPEQEVLAQEERVEADYAEAQHALAQPEEFALEDRVPEFQDERDEDEGQLGQGQQRELQLGSVEEEDVSGDVDEGAQREPEEVVQDDVVDFEHVDEQVLAQVGVQVLREEEEGQDEDEEAADHSEGEGVGEFDRGRETEQQLEVGHAVEGQFLGVGEEGQHHELQPERVHSEELADLELEQPVKESVQQDEYQERVRQEDGVECLRGLENEEIFPLNL